MLLEVADIPSNTKTHLVKYSYSTCARTNGSIYLLQVTFPFSYA